MDSLATAAIISEDPHAVLVEFSSVVADTQEYIIKVGHWEAVVGAAFKAIFREEIFGILLVQTLFELNKSLATIRL